MAQVPKNEPLLGIDNVGKSGVGTQIPDLPKGSPWEMGIAVPLRNRKFERGTLLEYTIDTDSFGRPGVEQSDSQFGIGAINSGPQNTPSNFIQHGDKALLGLSSHQGFPNHSEYIRIAGVGEVLTSLNTWMRGEIFPLGRNNRFEYEAGDKVSIYGTGCGDNWVPQDNRLLTLGIQRGVSSLNRRGFYLPQIGQISLFEGSLSDDYLAFQIQLPSHDSYTSSTASGEHSRAWGHLGLLPYRASANLEGDGYDWFYEIGGNSGIFRFLLSKNTDDNYRAVYTTDILTLPPFNIRISAVQGTNPFILREGSQSLAEVGDLTATGVTTSQLWFHPQPQRAQLMSDPINTVTISDGNNTVAINLGGATFNDYKDDPLGFAQLVANAINGEAGFQVEAEVPSLQPVGYPFYVRIINKGLNLDPTLNFGNEIKCPIILGFNHPGGHTTDYAQALMSIADEHSFKTGSFYENVGMLSQSIRPLSPQYPALVGDTHYRLGITWKGSIQASGATVANMQGSELFAGFRWNPLVGQGAQDHYPNAMMSTQALLAEDNTEQADWTTNLVTNYIDSANLDSLSDIQSNRFDILLKTRGQESYIDNSGGRGIELMAFVDQVWLEHQGDIPGGANGCVQITHYPNQPTLAVNRRSIKEAEILTMANGQQFNISSVLTGDKRIYEIDADFLNVPLPIYDQFRALLRWQDKGYFLTLHPYLPGVPHCLVGRMEISNEQKNHWDLTRYTFHFKFIEQD